MEPASFAVGVIGLAGLFSSCLDAVGRVQTYRSFAGDSNALDVQFSATKVRLQNWGRSVGFVDGTVSNKHHPALDEEATGRATAEVFALVKEICEPSARKSRHPSSVDGLPGSPRPLVPPTAHGESVSALRKTGWSLGGKVKRIDQVGLLKELVQQLHDLVPPDALPDAWSLQHADLSNSSSNGTSLFLAWSTEFRRTIARLEAQSKREVHGWLKHIPDDRYDDAVKKRLAGTCLWILDRPSFLEWISPDFSPESRAKVLWIHGPAGFGKTVMCANIVQHLKATLQTPVAHFFISSDSDSSEDPSVVLRSWISQLISQHDIAYEAALDARETDSNTTATRSAILLLFKALLRVAPGCTFIVDGLDECAHIDHAPNSITSFLEALIAAVGGSDTRILVVSRFLSTIQSVLKGTPHQTVWEYHIRPSDVRLDTVAYSRDIVDRKLAKKKDDVRMSLSQAMADRCEGQFLWLTLQGNSLRQTMPQKQIHRAIESTPTELDQVYDHSWRAVCKRNKYDKHRAASILRWASLALRPLKIDEVIEALLADDDDGLPFEDLPDSVDEEYVDREFVELCGPFLEIKIDPADPAPGRRTIHLPHFTVKEYLLRALPTPLWAPLDDDTSVSSFETIHHTLLALTCLRYVSHTSVWGGDEPVVGTFFREYAANSWNRHVKYGLSESPKIMKAATAFFAKDNPAWKAWRATIEAQGESVETGASSPGPLYYAVKLQLAALAIALLQEDSCDANDGIDQGWSPLVLACTDGATEIAVALLQKGADITATSRKGWTALYGSSKNGHFELVKLLVGRGSDKEQTNHLKRSPLFAASMGGHYHVVRLLVEEGWSLSTPDREGVAPLSAAVVFGHAEVARLLLDKGADITATDLQGRTPLDFAVYHNHLEVVRLLVEKGANITATDTNKRTALRLAVYNGHLEVTKLLLEKGADSTATGKYRQLPIRLAALGGHLEVARLLVEKGADVTAMDEQGRNPLEFATRNGHLEVVRLLLEKGADIRATDKHKRTPLQLAALKGHLEVVRLLLEKGADITATDKYGWTPLDLAVHRGHVEVVRLLGPLNAAYAQQCDLLGRAAIFYASHRGDVEVVRLLLSNKATDPTKVDWHGSTALFAAVRNGQIDVVKCLLDSGRVKLDSRDGFGHDVVWWARRTGNAQLVELLLSHADQMGAVMSDGEIPQPGVFASFDINQGWCDACTLTLPPGTGMSCKGCAGGIFCVCEACFGLGIRCLDPSHSLKPRGQ